MSKRAKSKRPHEHCKAYLSKRQRIKNKTQQLESRINHLKDPAKDVIKKNCRIGRIKEGSAPEDFKQKRPVVKEIKLHLTQEKCSAFVRQEYIVKKYGERAYFCNTIKRFVTVKQCKSCKKEN